MTGTQEKPSRTQRERSEATRAALLDAAVQCLAEHGYGGTTTGLVCERAGLSRGAHLHHFRTRAQLLAAALVEVSDRRLVNMETQVSGLPTGPERVEAALDLLWSAFQGPLFETSVDLAAAARTDPELRASLEPVERKLATETMRRCREMFASGPEDASADRAIQMALATIRGLALLPILQPGSRSAPAQWSFARGQLRELFAAS